MMKNYISHVLLGMSVLVLNVSAEVYTWEDRSGRRHYSDQPYESAAIIKINPGHSFYTIKKIFDGDTLLLANGEKIRLSGINTPEIASRHKLAEPGGEKAKTWLMQRLKNTKIRLETDLEKKDKYGRRLAHVFTEQGQHINIELVNNGLAVVSIFPPNLKYSEELLKAQRQAEHNVSGIWGNPFYAVKHYSKVADTKAWQRVSGAVTDVDITKKYLYLKFSERFVVKIERRFQKLFFPVKYYQGKTIEVRGWVSLSRGRYSMYVRHPSGIKIL